MSASLVGSEMCIRDSDSSPPQCAAAAACFREAVCPPCLGRGGPLGPPDDTGLPDERRLVDEGAVAHDAASAPPAPGERQDLRGASASAPGRDSPPPFE
eukprot:6645410-Alexandrium_andersonii.AAC.1